jgi:hypothetical protein
MKSVGDMLRKCGVGGNDLWDARSHEECDIDCMEGATTTYVNFQIASSIQELGTRWANRMAIWTSWLLIGSAVRFHRQLGSEMRPYGAQFAVSALLCTIFALKNRPLLQVCDTDALALPRLRQVGVNPERLSSASRRAKSTEETCQRDADR